MDTSGGANKIKYVRIYLGAIELYREYDSSANLIVERETHHLTDSQRKVAVLEVKTIDRGRAVRPTTIARYQYTNHLDSACLELNENAEILSYEEYHPFGTTSYSLHTNDSEVSLKRYKYVHKERDDESGLYYYGARYYAAWLCRFVSVDPLKDKYPFYATYQYAGNKPITFIDLDGLEEAKPNDTKVQSSPGNNDEDGSFISFMRGVSYFQPWNAYQIGITTGILAGLGETLSVVGRASLVGMAIDYFSGNDTLPEQIYSGLSALSEQLSTEEGREAFYQGLKLFAQEYWEEASFQEGVFDAGVAHGKLAFDAALTVLTGAGGVNALRKAIQQGPKAVSALLRKSAKEQAKPKNEVDEYAGSEHAVEDLRMNEPLLNPGAVPAIVKIEAETLRDFKRLVKSFKRDYRLSVDEVKQFEALTEKFGGKVRFDANPVKGESKVPHIQIEDLTPSINHQHLYLSDAAIKYLKTK